MYKSLIALKCKHVPYVPAFCKRPCCFGISIYSIFASWTYPQTRRRFCNIESRLAHKSRKSTMKEAYFFQILEFELNNSLPTLAAPFQLRLTLLDLDERGGRAAVTRNTSTCTRVQFTCTCLSKKYNKMEGCELGLSYTGIRYIGSKQSLENICRYCP